MTIEGGERLAPAVAGEVQDYYARKFLYSRRPVHIERRKPKKVTRFPWWRGPVDGVTQEWRANAEPAWSRPATSLAKHPGGTGNRNHKVFRQTT